jgi:hypothetical protein
LLDFVRLVYRSRLEASTVPGEEFSLAGSHKPFPDMELELAASWLDSAKA